VLPEEVSVGADVEYSGWKILNPRCARSAITSIFSGVLALHSQKLLRLLDSGIDLQPITDDPWIRQ
jgi:hypothetical protein